MHQGDKSIFTELIELVGEAITIRDVEGEIVYANGAALAHLGLDSPEQLRHRSSQSIMDDYVVEDEHGLPLTIDDVPSVRLIQGKPAPPLLMRVVNRGTGELRWNRLKTTPLHGEDRRLIGAITVIEDLTAVKAAEVQTRMLAETGRILASSTNHEHALRKVADIAVTSLADYCGIDLLDGSGRLEAVAAAVRDPAKQPVAKGLRDLNLDRPDPAGPAGRVLGAGISVFYPEITERQLTGIARSGEHLRLLRELEPRSVLIVPMLIPTRTIGMLTLATGATRQRLSDDDLALAEQLGRRAAVAVENLRLHARLAEVAETLQRSLLPDKLPEIAGWELASLYEPAAAEQRTEVGGDFYEFFEHEGIWFAIIGDVTGTGVRAASLTTLLRHGARVACRSEPEPATILKRLNEALGQYSANELCTALCLSLHEDHVTISSAGHPPALLVGAEGNIREAPSPGPLLGAFHDGQWPQEIVPVSCAETLVLYTDGVTEAPGSRGRFGADRLRGLLAEHAGLAPRDLLVRVDEAVERFRGGPATDDMAMLALRPGRR